MSLWANAISNSFELKCRIVHQMLLVVYAGASYTASPQDAGVGESWWAGVVFSQRQPTLVCGTLNSFKKSDGTFCRELVPYGSPFVVLHTMSIMFFHLWCMLRGGN